MSSMSSLAVGNDLCGWIGYHFFLYCHQAGLRWELVFLDHLRVGMVCGWVTLGGISDDEISSFILFQKMFTVGRIFV